MTAVEQSHDARAIANYILDRAPQLGVERLTIMQLLKLVYLSHGWSTAFCDVPLVEQCPQAWQYGPVYPTVYRALNHFGGNPVTDRIKDRLTGSQFYPNLSDYQRRVIDAVLKSYGKKHAFELSRITHQDGGPWQNAYEAKGAYSEIPLEDLRKHYKELAEARGVKSI
ncbi:Uncharacterized phage-associated protein [Agrobacterium fabrum]|uniref:Uncharacterized phage-associated protein n=1 Tax=Agrobacterium fabrum TaxID=1176649 RepID=A0A7Z7FLY3_9HYPH|nr:type II toxin-antitoxin system antitoxin SocA domain-containing protein [Agrobacterium fabrum]SDJ19147.1 Uncharacterized phage-associated protein [Agrobacterium fabrum]